MTIICAEQVAALAGHSEVVTLLLRKNCDIHAKDEDGKEAVDVARDAATLAQLNAVLHGRPSVKTLQMQEEARQAELDELAEELAEYAIRTALVQQSSLSLCFSVPLCLSLSNKPMLYGVGTNTLVRTVRF